MLHLEALQPGTFAILNSLMAMPALNDASLVGGTALALRYGHRVSVDLDLFVEGSFDRQQIIAALARDFEHEFVLNNDQAAKWAIFSAIEGIKVVNLQYTNVDEEADALQRDAVQRVTGLGGRHGRPEGCR